MDVSKELVAGWIEDTVGEWLTGHLTVPSDGSNCWLNITCSEIVNGQNTFRVELRSERYQDRPDRAFWVRLDVIEDGAPPPEPVDDENTPCRRCRWQRQCIICEGKACGWCPDCSPQVPD